MSCKELQADLVSYNSAINACDKGEQWERALDLRLGGEVDCILGLILVRSGSFEAILHAMPGLGQLQRRHQCMFQAVARSLV